VRFDGSDHAAKAELLDLLLEASRDGIVDWNLQTGETVYDPRWKHLLGFDSAGLAEYHETPGGWRELIHPNDRAQALRPIDDHIKQAWPLYTTARILPSDFGPCKTVFNRFDRWAGKGIWQRLFEALRQDHDDEWHSIDSTIKRAHQHAAGAKGGPRSTASVVLVVA
jgi:PAS domain-containing protein